MAGEWRAKLRRALGRAARSAAPTIHSPLSRVQWRRALWAGGTECRPYQSFTSFAGQAAPRPGAGGTECRPYQSFAHFPRYASSSERPGVTETTPKPTSRGRSAAFTASTESPSPNSATTIADIV